MEVPFLVLFCIFRKAPYGSMCHIDRKSLLIKVCHHLLRLVCRFVLQCEYTPRCGNLTLKGILRYNAPYEIMVKSALHELRTNLTNRASALVVEIHELLCTEVGIVEIMALDEAGNSFVDFLCRESFVFEFLTQSLFAVCLPCKIIDCGHQRCFIRCASAFSSCRSLFWAWRLPVRF